MNYTEDQRAAIERRAPRICVDAGAGSGKTRVLIDRIVHLLAEGTASLDQVVAITFTDRAAAEMKGRLRRALHGRVVPDGFTPERWRRLERQAEHARITTIHTFCGALIRENGLHLGLDPDFAVLDESQSELLLNRVVRDVLHQLLEDDDGRVLSLCTEFPFKRISAMIGAMLRRRFLLERVSATTPWETASDLAAFWETTLESLRRDLVTQAAKDEKAQYFRHELETLGGECADFDDRMEINRRKALAFLAAIGSEMETAELFQQAQDAASINMAGGSKKNWGSSETLAALKDVLKEFRVWVGERFPQWKATPEVVGRSAELTVYLFQLYDIVLDALEKEKARLGCLGFDDIILRALHALRDDEMLRTRLAQSIRFLLIDEFQDTDGIQLEIARLLADTEGGPELFIVGDAKQSIYYFRGAEVEVFASQREAANDTIPLDKNFRTQASIIAFINSFFEKSNLLKEVEPEYRMMGAHRETLGEDRIAFLMVTDKEEKENADALRRREAALLANHIKSICSGGLEIEEENTGEIRPAGYGDVAILFRGMGHVQVYEEAFRRSGIPYALVAGGGFYERQEVLDVLNLLKVIIDPWDEMALLGFLRSPMAGLSDNDITGLALAGGLARIFQTEEIPDALTGPDTLGAARALVATLRAKQFAPLNTFLNAVYDATHYEAILLSQYLGLQKVSNLRKLLMVAEEFAQSRTPSLREFVHYLESVRSQAVREGEALLQPEDRGAVTIMTIHKSKGLEFPVVAIPELGVIPPPGNKDDLVLHRHLGAAVRVLDANGESTHSAMGQAIGAQTSAEEREERARVLYVALTRARDYLILSGVPGAGKGSYMRAFDEMYSLSEKSDGASIAGPGWRARVLREETDEAPVKKEAMPRFPAWAETSQRLSGPLEGSGGGAVSISRLLDALVAPDPEAEDEAGVATIAEAAPATGNIGLIRGALVHRLLEIWDGTGEAPVAEVLESMAPPLGLRRRLEEDLQGVAASVSTLPIRDALFARGCQREVPFSMALGGSVLSGVIDLVLEDQRIADYKTGRFHPGRHERYLWQLRLYGLAMYRCRGLIPTEGLLIYVDEPRVESLVFDQGLLDATAEAVNAALSASAPGALAGQGGARP